MTDKHGNAAADGVPDPGTSCADLPTFRLDKGAFSVVSLDQADDDGLYWATKTVEERLTALEYMRRMAYGNAATARLQRVLEVVQRPPA